MDRDSASSAGTSDANDRRDRPSDNAERERPTARVRKEKEGLTIPSWDEISVPDEDRTEVQSDRTKQYGDTIDKAAEEFICPITAELPVDPVTAGDGRVYERPAIEEHIRRNGRNLRSPVTNETMGPELLPAVQVRNSLEKMVKSGAISGDKADRWKQRIEDEKEVEKIKALAESRDVEAMRKLGFLYAHGRKGLKKDAGVACTWFRKVLNTAEPKSVDRLACMTQIAFILIKGTDSVDKNLSEGMALLGAAAQGGSAGAAYLLGNFYFTGGEGIPRDLTMAKSWLQMAISNKSVCDDINSRGGMVVQVLLSIIDEQT